MLTRKIRLTRPDHATVAGGIILYSLGGQHIVHYFERERGSAQPKRDSFWQGSYFDSLLKAELEFERRVTRARGYQRGGSLIPLDREVAELSGERERV